MSLRSAILPSAFSSLQGRQACLHMPAAYSKLQALQEHHNAQPVMPWPTQDAPGCAVVEQTCRVWQP